MEDTNKCPDCEELLRASLECYKSLRRKYPVRTHWTPEFEVWRTTLERLSGKDLEVFWWGNSIKCLQLGFSIKIDPVSVKAYLHGWERDFNRIWKAG